MPGDFAKPSFLWFDHTQSQLINAAICFGCSPNWENHPGEGCRCCLVIDSDGTYSFCMSHLWDIMRHATKIMMTIMMTLRVSSWLAWEGGLLRKLVLVAEILDDPSIGDFLAFQQPAWICWGVVPEIRLWYFEAVCQRKLVVFALKNCLKSWAHFVTNPLPICP